MRKFISIDFDGTIVKHEYPDIGEEVPGAIDKMKKWQSQGHRLILFTMRSGIKLRQAVQYCQSKGIRFYSVNRNPTQVMWTSSPKVDADVYIDDKGFGIPLIIPENPKERPYVDWSKIEL